MNDSILEWAAFADKAVRAAGNKIVELYGEAFICSNPGIFDELLSLLRSTK